MANYNTLSQSIYNLGNIQGEIPAVVSRYPVAFFLLLSQSDLDSSYQLIFN